MATTEEVLALKIKDAKRAQDELKQVERSIKGVQGSTEASGKAAKDAARSHDEAHHAIRKFGSGLTSAIGYGAGAIGLMGVGYGLKDIVQGGIRAQEQQVLLQQALRQTGQYGSRHIDELNRSISATSSSGGFSREEQTQGLGEFVRLTKSSSQAVRLNAEAMKLARGAHMGYGQAVSMVERIQTGQVGRLQKYLGIIVPVKTYVEKLTTFEKKYEPWKKKWAEEEDKKATAMEANRRVLERYGGSMEAYNKTAAGSVSNANNAFKELTEQIGEKLLPVVTAAAKGFSELINEVKAGNGVWGEIGSTIKTVWEGLEGIGSFIGKNKWLQQLIAVVGGGALLAVGAKKVLGLVPGSGLLGKHANGVLEKATGGLIGGERGASPARPLWVRQVGGGGGGGGIPALAGDAAAASGDTGLVVGGGSIATAGAIGLGIPAFMYGGKALSKLIYGSSADPLATPDEGGWLSALFGFTGKAHGFAQNTHATGGGRASGSYQHEESVARKIIERGYHAASYKGLTPREIELIEKAFKSAAEHTHREPIKIYLDGKELAKLIGDHAVRHPQVGRKFAEGSTKYALQRNARA